MSKLYTLMLAISSLFVVQAQNCDTIFYDDGTANLVKHPDQSSIAVATIDGDGAEFSQYTGYTGSYYIFKDSISPTDSNFYYWSTSWFNPADTAEDYLIYDNIYMPDNSNELSWEHRMTDSSYRDGYFVMIVSTTNDNMDLLERFEFNDPRTSSADRNWTLNSVTIPETYSNDSVAIYFVHDTYDGYTINFDNIALTSCASDEPTDTTVTDTTVTDTTVTDTTVIDDTTSNSDTVIVVDGDTVYITIYDTVTIIETVEVEVEVPGDDITATININIEGSCDDIATGLTEGDFDNTQLTAYPNPVADVLNININNTSSIQGDITINIYNVTGAKVMEEVINGSNAVLDMTDLDAGYYVIEVIGGNAVLAHEKFMKN